MSIGVAAHITAASIGGPRFDPALQSQDRGSAENGIWLCQNCAKLVDSDTARFTAAVLREWRATAEAEALEHIGRRPPFETPTAVLDSIHGQLRRESNPRFGFSFIHPSVWDREDPANGDGNIYRHPQDTRIELRAWGGYAVVSPDLDSWVAWTIECLQNDPGFRLLSKTPSGRHLIDWSDLGGGRHAKLQQQVEGYRITYRSEEDGQSFTTMQTFVQFGDTQIGLRCQAPSSFYERYEELFLVISKEIRILGANSARYARTGDTGGIRLTRLWRKLTAWLPGSPRTEF